MKPFVVLLGLAVMLEGAALPNPIQLNAEGLQFFRDARYREAESLFRQALEAWDRAGDENVRDRIVTSGNLALLLRTEGHFAEAEVLLLDCLRRAEAALGPDSTESGRAAASLASLYQAMGQLQKAEAFAVRANWIFEQTPHDVAERADNRRILASIYIEEGRYEPAEGLLHSLLPGVEDRLAVGIYNDLAVAALQQNQLAKAEKFAIEALDLAARVLPMSHPLRASTLNNLAQICRFQGRFVEAEQHYREAIALWEEALGPGNPSAGKGIMNLAAFYHQRGRETGAEELYGRAAAIFEAVYGREHPLTLVARNELAEVLRSEQRFSESERLNRATLPVLEKMLGDRDARVLRARSNYARLLDDTKHRREAAALRARIEERAKTFY